MTLDGTEPTENAPVAPAEFYTGLVAELYAALRSVNPDPEPLVRFIGRYGTPALELGCGDGDPLLDLRRRGIDIEGLDSSADMLDRCRARAAEAGVHVVLDHSTMESMHLGKLYRSIVIAGPTFNLLVDDDTALAALECIAAHLDPEGAALVPLFVPPIVDRLGRPSETRTPTGELLRCTPIAVDRDEAKRVQLVTLRYERETSEGAEVLDRDWVLHWYTPSAFRDLATAAGLVVRRCIDPRTGEPATDDAASFVMVLGAAKQEIPDRA
jgi:SAM-dependent methyltransferase